MKFKEITDPSWLRKNDWPSSFQLNPDFETRKHNKRFMVTKRIEGVPLDRIVKKLTTGIQAQYIDVNNGKIPYEYTFTNGRAYNFDDSVDNIARSIVYGSRDPAIIFMQVMEDSNIHGSSNLNQFERWAKTEAISARISELLFELDGVPVEDNWNLGDYFAGIYNANNNSSMDNMGYERSVRQVKSVEEARKTATNQQGEPILNNYEAQGYWKHRHNIFPAYLEGLGTQFQGRGLYSAAYSIIRSYIQRNDRKLVAYASGTVEGLSLPGVDRAGVSVRFPIRDTEFDLMRLSPMEGGYKIMKAYSVMYLMLTQGMCTWDDNSQVGLNDKNFGMSWYGGAEPWKNEVQKGKGDIEIYNPNNPNHPKSETTGGQFATNHTPHNNGSFAGNVMYGEFWDRCNRSLKWAEFSYKQNGVSYSGYKDGDKPEMGEYGAEVSRLGLSNVGDANAAHQWYNGKRDMLFRGEGDAGIVYVGFSVKAGFAGTTTYTVPEGTFTRRGNGVFAFIPE